MQSTNRIDTGMAADPAWQGMQYRVQPVYGASRPASHLVRQAPGTMRSNPPPGADTMPRLIPLHPTHPIDPRLARCAWQWLVLGLLLSATLPEARGYSTAIGWLWYWRSEEHTSELQSLMRISYAVFCLKKKKKHKHHT